jgi:hypothetical protein
MSAHFSQSEWQKITQLFDKISNDPQLAESFGLPEQRDGSVVIGSFNIRKLGGVGKRTPESWEFLTKIIKRFDLMAVQEVMDDSSGLKYLTSQAGENYTQIMSDTSGAKSVTQGSQATLLLIVPKLLIFFTRAARNWGRCLPSTTKNTNSGKKNQL